MSQFILMLTHDDRTIPNALELYEELADTGVSFIGFKDVGLPKEQLETLVAAVRQRGHSPFLEVVSLTAEDELRSVQVGLSLEVDYLIGGTRPRTVLPELDGSSIKYFPYVGRVIGHPATLEGTIDEIVAEALEVQALGVDGINLLAYRHAEGSELAAAVKEAVDVPLICAGSIDSVKRVKAMAQLDVWAFTIGGAVVQRQIVPGASMAEQVRAVLQSATLAPEQA